MIHTYFMIHDDLPSMDDDDLRRGRPLVTALWRSEAILAVMACKLSRPNDSLKMILNGCRAWCD